MLDEKYKSESAFEEDPVDEEYLTDAEESNVEKLRKRPRYLPYEVVEMEQMPSVDWLIKGIIPERGYGVLWGPPKQHKTFVGLDMALHVAMGLDYYGHPVKQKNVLYIIAEGQDDFGNRIKAWCMEHGFTTKDLIGKFRVIKESLMVDLLTSDKALKKEFFSYANRNEEGDTFEVGLTFVDTLNRNSEGDENTQTDMTRFNRGCYTIIDTYKSSVVVIHHTGWDRSRMRGSTTLLGAVDVSIRVGINLKKKLTSMFIDDARHGPSKWEILFSAKRVVTDFEQDRDSLVMVLEQGDKEAESPSGGLTDEEEELKKPLSTDDLALVRLAEMGSAPSRSSLATDEPGMSRANIKKVIGRLIQRGLVDEGEGDEIHVTKAGRDRALGLGAEIE